MTNSDDSARDVKTGRTRYTVSPTRVSMHDCELRVLDGIDKGRILKVQRGAATVGKAPDNDLVLFDPAVSRNHVRIRDDSEGLFVEDLESTNGTTVDGVRIKQAYVKPGARIQLGETILTVELRDTTVQVPASVATAFHGIVGESPSMQQLFGQLEMFARSELSILLHGETGTGKELVARAIHQASSRAQQPYGVVDCAGTEPAFMASALFGHRKGAFTGAADARKGILLAANGGTVFIDEIGELPLDMQPRLLRVLDQRSIMPIGADTYSPLDVRYVSATHRDLKSMVRDRQFRPDLLYRLSTVVLLVPPLRDRKEDIAPLCRHFLGALGQSLELDEAALSQLQAHNWPGNVRELRNVVERAAVAAKGGRIKSANLMIDPMVVAPAPVPLGGPAAPAGSPATLEDVERRAILSALQAAGGHREKAAHILGITSKTLREKIKRYGISR